MLLLATAFAADPTIQALIDSSLAQDESWSELVELSDDIGARLSGSESLQRAVRWAAQRMREDGLAVQLQETEVPHWVRGAESASILAPVSEPLGVLGLGMTVPTAEGGVKGRVLVARDFEALEALGAKVKGKIVLFDPPWDGYGNTVKYRIAGADRAAALGAVAVLLRSVTDHSHGTPHTGTLVYKGETKIPAAAVTHESADRIRRWWERGRRVVVKLDLHNERLPDAHSANVVGEVVGRELPAEVVLLGCHLDSWDVGTGAQDDGAACVAVMEAVAQIAALPKRPRRSVRAVLFTNEENGLAGGKAYAEANPERVHVALVESDTGMGGTLGFRIDGGLPEGDPEETGAPYVEALRPLLEPLEPLGVTVLEGGYAGADVGPMLHAHGGLGLGVKHDMTGYWPIHHTEADTLDKIDPHNLQVEVAALAALAWQLAELDDVPGENR